MSRDDLRAILPRRIVRGALLRGDGAAVGLVAGGAVTSELATRAELAQQAALFHSVLMALDYPVHVYVLDALVDFDAETEALIVRQRTAQHPAHAAILGELAERLLHAASPLRSVRPKQAVWAVEMTRPIANSLAGVTGIGRAARRSHNAGLTLLALAQDRARRLAGALAALHTYPTPHLMEPEAIAQLVYRTTDPVRAQHYPLHSLLLQRVQQAVRAGDREMEASPPVATGTQRRAESAASADGTRTFI